MIVCVCRRVSHTDIEHEARHGCSSFDELQQRLGVATACGRCREHAKACLADASTAAAARPVARTRRAVPMVVRADG